MDITNTVSTVKNFLSTSNPSNWFLKFIFTLSVVLFMVIIQIIINKVIWKNTNDVKNRYRWQKVIKYSIGLISILIIGMIWFKVFQSITTFLGLLAGGIAIALKDVLLDIAGWLYILWRKPFEVGDRVEVGMNRGDVIDMAIMEFTLLEIGNWVDADQSTGRIVHIPNQKILNTPFFNYNKGFQFIWNEIKVLLTFESNWKKAKDILTDIMSSVLPEPDGKAEKQIKEAARQFMIFYEHLSPVIYTNVEASGVELTLRFMTPPRKRRIITHEFWEKILDEFAQHEDIQFAYPTVRYYQSTAKKNQPFKNREAE